jgi:hypothetical protein
MIDWNSVDDDKVGTAQPTSAPTPIFTGIPWSPNAPSGFGGGF